MTSTPELTGTVAAPVTMDLYGIYGSFKLPNSVTTIKYVSTFASSSGSPGHITLLDQLRPMRERTEASEISELSTLLQRDLNDNRVGSQLVPYLLGKKSSVGFFPAILAVLVPKDFMASSADRGTYPVPARLNDRNTDYGGCWAWEQFALGSEKIPLGLLKVVLPKSDIIVLDGQHRASAFRFVSGAFPPKNTIYEAFYGSREETPELLAELPVTLIWFEVDDGAESVSPQIISRQLFVDVNNNAKPVSPSRTILLDDRSVSSIGTQEVYRAAAQHSFSADRFSLLHSAFDLDVELSSASLPRFALTTPETIEDCLRWAFFCSSRYEELSIWAVNRMREPANRNRFLTIFADFDDVQRIRDEDESLEFVLRDQERAEVFRNSFKETYRHVITQLFSELDFLRPHYAAAKEVSTWVSQSGTAIHREVWTRVFCGGEGLYWVIRGASRDGLITDYQKAIDEIEKKFITIRKEQHGADEIRLVSNLYDTFASKAFQIGYVMAVDYVAQNSGDWNESAAWLIQRLNEYDFNQWSVILNELRPKVVGTSGTTPRTWPAHRNLLIRLADGPRGEIYSGSNLFDSPEWRCCENSIREVCAAIATTHDSKPGHIQINDQCEAALKHIDDIIDRARLKASWFDREAVLRRMASKVDEELDSKYGISSDE